jgi:flagellar hook-basal body complex protein FliE
MPIDPLTLTSGGASVLSGSKAGASGHSAGFGDALGKLINGIEQSTDQANTAVSGMLDKTTDVHEAMIALQQSQLTLELTMQIRNKFVQAYQDVMRMPI